MLASNAADVMAVVGSGSMALYLLILAIKVWLARRGIDNPPGGPVAPADFTILQPILGGDPWLEETLRSNLAITPASARFLWLIDRDDDDARRITDSLATQSHGRAAPLICPPAPADTNPKTFKLDFGMAGIQSEFFAVLDDDTVLGDQILADALRSLESCTLYTALPCYLPGSGVWANLVAQFVNNNSALTYLAVQPVLGCLTINGMCYVMRTSVFRAAGGFGPMLSSLCDDYALAKLVKQHGGTIRQGSSPLYLRTTVRSCGAYVRLLHRWFVFANVLVRDQRLGVKAILFVLLALPALLLWLAMLGFLGGLWSALGLVAGLTIRDLAMRYVLRKVFGTKPRFSTLLSVASELLQPFHWTHALLQRTIQWRTRRLRVKTDGTFVTLDEPGP